MTPAVPMTDLPMYAKFRWLNPGFVVGQEPDNPVKINYGTGEVGDPSRGCYVVEGEQQTRSVYNPDKVMVVPVQANDAAFGATLARLRESAGLTLQDLGEAAGLSRQRVHQLETWAVKPTWAVVQALATALDVSTEVFRDPES
jgi:DNA-binding XRE family transcriptional regulator